MTASHADLLSLGEERVLVGRQGPSAISSGVDPRERLLDRRSQATPGGAEHSLQPAVVPAAPDEAAAEEDRMRLLAALLALGALLVWIVFLAG